MLLNIQRKKFWNKYARVGGEMVFQGGGRVRVGGNVLIMGENGLKSALSREKGDKTDI